MVDNPKNIVYNQRIIYLYKYFPDGNKYNVLWRIRSFATQRLPNTRYITKTGVSIASQRLGIPRQRLK
jgi:hypothetical protein